MHLRSATPAAMAPKDWGHPSGMPLEEVEVGQFYSGVVTNVSPYGVFVDFGAVKDGLLRVPAKRGRDFRKGFEVQNMAVLSCDPESGRVVLQPEEDSMPAPRARASSQGPPGRGAGVGGGGNAARRSARSAGPSARQPGPSAGPGPARRRQPRDWSHPGGMLLEEIQPGEAYEGTVTNVSPYGVFVDIGAEKDARLSVPTKIGRRFRIGDVVPNCRLEIVDVDRNLLSASLDDPEEVVRDLPPKERRKQGSGMPKAAAKSAAKATAKRRAASAGPPAAESRPPAASPGATARASARPAKAPPITLEDVKVQTVVSGVVTYKGPLGVFVDIGCGKDAKLKVPKRVSKDFRRGDEVYGMLVEEVDLDKRQLVVSLEDPELTMGAEEDVDKAPVAPAPAVQPKSKAKAKPKGKAAPREPSQPRFRYQEGDVVQGVVTRIGLQAVFVDIGAEREGVVRLPKRVAQQFRPNDEVSGMIIESVDASTGRIELSLEDPEIEEPAPVAVPASRAAAPPAAPAPAKARASSRPPRAEAKAKEKPAPKAKPRAEPKAELTRSQGKNWGHDGAIPVEELEVGSEASGVVTNVNQYGLFLNIGAVRDGRLNVSAKDRRKFKRGDRVEGMIIESVNADTGQIGLSLPYVLGDAPEEYIEPEEEASVAPAGADRGQGGGGGRSGTGAGTARPVVSGRTTGARPKGPAR